jgi:hypothetical protein
MVSGTLFRSPRRGPLSRNWTFSLPAPFLPIKTQIVHNLLRRSSIKSVKPDEHFWVVTATLEHSTASKLVDFKFLGRLVPPW